MSSGNLVNILEKHYQRVVAIRISNDLCRFISAGEDGLVMIWDFAKCLVEQDSFSVTMGSSNLFDPLKIINNSSGKINDVYLSSSASASTRGGHFSVASEDNHCKVYSLQTGELLATVLFEHPVRCVVMDRSERFLFCGLNNGDIAQSALCEWMKIKGHGASDGKVIDMTKTLTLEEGMIK